jgi:CheY-like chemotaxis protein
MAHESLQNPGGAEERRYMDRRPRVLIADDDRDMVSTLATLLGDEGYVVYTAFSGKEVLPAVRIVRPDAIIVDVAIPQMSGYAIAQAIRQSFMDLRRPLLIAISGFWKEFPDRKIAEQVGFDHYLAKPAEPAAILELLAPLQRR